MLLKKYNVTSRTLQVIGRVLPGVSDGDKGLRNMRMYEDRRRINKYCCGLTICQCQASFGADWFTHHMITRRQLW